MPAAELASTWVLTLYVSGAGPQSSAAIAAVREICASELDGHVELTIVDVNDSPDHVIEDHILAVPTLVRRSPPPVRQLVGGLSDIERVRVGLEMLTAVPPDADRQKEKAP